MLYNFQEILQNKPLEAAVLAWALAQGIKILLTLITEKRFDATRIVGTGGMPSSHSSFTMALSFSVGKYYGFASPLFAIALVFSFVAMYDAQGIRRAAGKHAEILNDLIQHHKMPGQEELKELLGHTPVEVFAGAILGIVVGLWL